MDSDDEKPDPKATAVGVGKVFHHFLLVFCSTTQHYPVGERWYNFQKA